MRRGSGNQVSIMKGWLTVVTVMVGMSTMADGRHTQNTDYGIKKVVAAAQGYRNEVSTAVKDYKEIAAAVEAYDNRKVVPALQVYDNRKVVPALQVYDNRKVVPAAQVYDYRKVVPAAQAYSHGVHHFLARALGHPMQCKGKCYKVVGDECLWRHSCGIPPLLPPA
nr:uncharacterized protein LOC123775213 [Procambarus clarkii]